MKLNPYKILRLDPSAPPEVIKAAYRALMKSKDTHPDLGGSHDVALEINKAYELLSDPIRKKEIDIQLKAEIRKSDETNQVEEKILVICLHCQTINELFDKRHLLIASCGKCNESFSLKKEEDTTFYKHPSRHQQSKTRKKKQKRKKSVHTSKIEFAKYLYSKGLYIRALRDYSSLIRESPQNSELYYAAGLCAYRLKNYIEASQLFLKATVKSPTNYVFHWWLGNALFKANHLNEACEFLERALTLEPTNLNCLGLLGNIYYKIGNYQKAVKYCKLVVLEKPALYQSIYRLALSYYHLRNFKQALEAFHLAKQIFPHNNHLYEMIQHCKRHLRTL